MCDKDEKKNNDQKDVTCSSCSDKLAHDHIGIKCSNGHHLCPDECSQNFVNTIMADPMTKIPVKCATCQAAVFVPTFERQLSAEQHEKFLMVSFMHQLPPDEMVQTCGFCSYAEIWSKNGQGMLFFHCKSEKCNKATCTICKLEFIPPKDGIIDEEYPSTAAAVEYPSTSFFYHTECPQLAPALAMFQDAIEEGTGVRCPSCQHLGRKDDACTHITCPKCQTMFCYLCGGDEATVDKAPGNVVTIYAHNEDWDINPRRCPMYLTQISELDDRWSHDDADCVTRISRIRTISKLRAAVQTMDEGVFARLVAKFASVANSGYTGKEIMEEDIELIHRPISVLNGL